MSSLRWALAISVALFVNEVASASEPQAQPRASSNPAFILYASPASRSLLAGDPVDLKARVNRWRDLLRERGASFTIVTHPAQLAQMAPGAALVLPSAVVLNDEERRVIAERIASGESLLATWMPGTLDARGAGVAPAFLEQAFRVSARIALAQDKGFLITAGDTPLTYAVPAGTRLWVGQDKRYSTPLLTTPGAGYLADWSRAAGETGLITFTTVGTSRRALLGWPESAWEGEPAQFRKLAHLALDWVEGKPVVFARGWPAPYQGAMTIGVDALWRFENIPRIVEVLSSFGARGSFHFLPADAAANAALIRDLVSGGHSVGGFGDQVQPFAGQSETEQRARVERMVRGFRSALGADFVLSGLRAPQGATDAATERAAAPLGYLVDSGRIDSALPSLAENRRLVLLSASANFDTTPALDAIATGLAEASSKARLLKGYAFVGVDAAGFLRDAPLEIGLIRFGAAAGKEKGLWLASAADVAAWWREREQLKITSAWNAADSTMTLNITVGDPMRFAAAIAVIAPPARKTVRLEDTLAGVQLDSEANGEVALLLTGLPAGEHRLRLRFLP